MEKNSMSLYRIVAIVLLVCWSTPTIASAIGGDKKEGSSASRSEPDKSSAKTAKPRLQLTPERQAAALTFVKQHHSELAELLIQLEENHPNEYQKALRDLFRTSERLAQVREKDQPRYQQDLSLWKVRSRIQLVTAKIKMKRSPELKRQLEAALNEEIDLRATVLNMEKQKLAARISRIDKQLESLEANRSRLVNNHMRQVTEKKPPTKKTTSVKTNPPTSTTKTSPPKTSPPKTSPPKTSDR
ncbi:MAG: hypothetical protein ACI9G1_004768 [Pirellulaceae bacterium]